MTGFGHETISLLWLVSKEFAGNLDPIESFSSASTQGRVCQMDLSQAVDLIRHTLILALIVSAPMLLIGMVVGIIVSLFQAVTQIQEQTLTFIPKIVSMFAAAILLMPWMSNRLMEYTASMFLTGQLP
jgi:flagellar biosynthetic protein FliQ